MRFMSTKEASDALGVTTPTIRAMVEDGRLSGDPDVRGGEITVRSVYRYARAKNINVAMNHRFPTDVLSNGFSTFCSMELVAPYADTFDVYGDEETVERCIEWADRNRYLLVRGLAQCAHGLYGMTSCPGTRSCNTLGLFDHTDLWVQDQGNGVGHAFLLSHPNTTINADLADTYGRSHGLVTTAYAEFDAWYGGGDKCIRWDIPSGWPYWPIEQTATLMLVSQPVRWDSDE